MSLHLSHVTGLPDGQYDFINSVMAVRCINHHDTTINLESVPARFMGRDGGLNVRSTDPGLIFLLIGGPGCELEFFIHKEREKELG